MDIDILKDAINKFSNEYILAAVVLCILLASLTYALFGGPKREKFRFAAFVLVVSFFSGAMVSIFGILAPSQSSELKVRDLPDEIEEAPAQTSIIIPAYEFTDPINVALGPLPNLYGPDVLMNAPPFGNAENAASFHVDIKLPGQYELWIRYAAAEARPLTIEVNGQVTFPAAISEETGGWNPEHQTWRLVGPVELNQGDNVIRLSRSDAFPHISSLLLIKENG